MKARIFLVAILMSLSNLGFAQAKGESVTIKTAIYCDHCKKCESCGGRLETVLYKEAGVRKVFIDAKKETIYVAYNSKKTSLKTIKTVITQSGYDADEMKAEAVAYEKLDDCCKKK